MCPQILVADGSLGLDADPASWPRSRPRQIRMPAPTARNRRPTDVRTSTRRPAKAGGARTLAAPRGRRARRRGARSGGVSRSIASPSSAPKRSLSIAFVAATASREVREKTLDPVLDARVELAGRDQLGGEAVRARPGARRAPRRSAAARAPRSRRAPPAAAACPALLATRPMPTSGVISGTRSVQSRRSQLAANSSAPPTHTPSTAAIDRHRCGEHDARQCAGSPRSSPPTRRCRPRARDCRSSPAEKWSPAPRSTTQRTAASAPAASIASAIAVIVVEVPGVAPRLAVPGDQARGAAVGGGDGHGAVSLLSGLDRGAAAGRRAPCGGRCGSCARPPAASRARAASTSKRAPQRGVQALARRRRGRRPRGAST